MISIRIFGFPLLCLINAAPLYAADSTTASGQYAATASQDASSSSGSMEDLTNDLVNLGGYLGYTITTALTTTPVSTLLNYALTSQNEQGSFVTWLGGLITNTANSSLQALVPPGSPYAAINQATNYTFSGQSSGSTPYNSASSWTDGQVTANALIDTTPYAADPTSQFLTNIFNIPDYTYNLNNDQTAFVSPLPYSMYDNLIPYNVMGTPLPNPTEYFSTACTANVIPQVNVSTLIAPLQYGTSTASQSSTSSSSSSSSSSCSTQTQLIPTSQAENAYLFTKYALNDFLEPSGRPSYSAYQTAYSNATATPSSTTSSVTIEQNYSGIVQYFMLLRNYAAGSSVAHDNLYQILSKRMPQSSGSNSTSQALSEFQMATSRLYNPTGNGTSQWLQGINEASPATVQKEMAALLAEINYQLYLMRQTEERELLTLSIMLMTQLNQTAPNFSQIMQSATQQSSS